MEIRARNQLRGTVKSVVTDGLTAEVVVDVGGQEIASTITRASAERLGLKKGDVVVAIIKASEVLIDTGSPVSADYKSPFRFTGTIKKVEVKLEDEKLSPAEQAELKKMPAAVEAARH